MKFQINRILLRFKNGTERTLNFEKNKINVITGKPGTGKTSVLKIIDYCLCSSKPKIAEAVINENIEWYGLDFTINSKHWFIARKSIVDTKPSKDIYFSSVGKIPKTISPNIEISLLKAKIDEEYGITPQLVFPYGGKEIQTGSKISFRYFNLLVTQSEDVISQENIFFDFSLHDRERYQEAFERIFDLIIGANDSNKVMLKDRANYLENEINRFEKKKKNLEKRTHLFEKEILKLYSSSSGCRSY